jgi:hypothetical protein
MGQLYALSLGVGPRGLAEPERAREADERSRVVELALRPESRPESPKATTRVGARGAEPRRTEFELQGQQILWRPGGEPSA